MQSNCLYPTILSPTRVATVLRDGQYVITKSLIDNIYLNTQKPAQSGTLEISITDHYAVFVSLPEYKVPLPDEETTIQFRSINDWTIRKFAYALENNSE